MKDKRCVICKLMTDSKVRFKEGEEYCHQECYDDFVQKNREG